MELQQLELFPQQDETTGSATVQVSANENAVETDDIIFTSNLIRVRIKNLKKKDTETLSSRKKIAQDIAALSEKSIPDNSGPKEKITDNRELSKENFPETLMEQENAEQETSKPFFVQTELFPTMGDIPSPESENNTIQHPEDDTLTPNPSHHEPGDKDLAKEIETQEIETPKIITFLEKDKEIETNIPTSDLKEEENKQTEKEIIPEEKNHSKRGRKSYKDNFPDLNVIEVPSDDILDQKLYYGIGEVAGWFKVNTSQIRYWENEFSILQPRKNRKGDRLFRKEDIKNLKLIYYLLRIKKYSIEGAREYLKANKKKVEMQSNLVELLSKIKDFLILLNEKLEDKTESNQLK